MEIPFTIRAYLNRSFELHAQRPFLGFVDENMLTYAQVKDEINNIVHLLKQHNIHKGDKVAILSGNMPNWGITYFAVVSMGAVAVPVLPDFTAEEFCNIMEHSESKALFISELQMPKSEQLNKSKFNLIVKINDLSVLHSVETIEVTDEEDIVVEEDLAAIIYTSGTTGHSKGVMLTHKNLAFNTISGSKSQTVTPDDRFLSVLPLSHTYENTLGLLLPMISGASVYYLKKPPTPTLLVNAMGIVKPTLMLTVPLIIEKIFRNKVLPALQSKFITRKLYRISFFRKLLHKAAGKKLMKTFGGQLHFFGIGGAKLDGTVEKFLIDARFPYAIGYGLTETSPFLAGMTPEMVRWQSTGTAVYGVELKLHDINPETGYGEIWAKGPNIMKGYYKNPQATAEVITQDGWFKTGDLATIDENGYVYIKGRIKNVIIGANGENIFPEEIESLINNFDYVEESLVMEKEGRLVALIHFNIEALAEKFSDMKSEVADYVDVKIKEISTELQMQINSRLKSFSAIKLIVPHPEPFEKTPTQKIKRYKYQ